VTSNRDEQFRAYVFASRGGLLRTATFLASGDRFHAEDLVQTALMRLYVAWPRVRAETVDAYARKAMLNALIDDRRRPFARRVVALTTGRLDGSGATHPAAATGGTATTQPIAPRPTSTNIQPNKVLAVRLIAYTGKQLDGFTVARVPEGWRLSGSTPYALTINSQRDTNDNPDVFQGKLTVLLQSQDASGLPNGQSVMVNGNPGVVTNSDEQMLTYNDGNGHTVVVQAPTKLSWTSTQIVSFAEGVQVTGNAIAGRG
jgi:hypothetical protein